MRPDQTVGSRRLRTSMSGTELRVWLRIRGRKLDGWKFRRQEPIGPYFCCPAARLVVEIDGPIHDESSLAYDVRRQAWLEAEGYRVLRIPVSWVDADADAVAETIRDELVECGQRGLRRRFGAAPSAPGGATSP